MHPDVSRHRGAATRRDPKVFVLWVFTDDSFHRLPTDNVQLTPNQVWIEAQDGVHNVRVLQRVDDVWRYCGPGDVIQGPLNAACPFVIAPYGATLPPPTAPADLLG